MVSKLSAKPKNVGGLGMVSKLSAKPKNVGGSGVAYILIPEQVCLNLDTCYCLQIRPYLFLTFLVLYSESVVGLLLLWKTST